MHVVFGGGPSGMATARALAGRGVPVRVVTRRPRAPSPGLDFVDGDVLDAGFAARAAAGAEVVYFCLNAPYHRWPQEFPPLQRAVVGAARTAGARRLVVLENVYGYGPVDVPMTEDLPLSATTRKGSTRAAMTNELLAVHAAGDLEVAIGRAVDFFGPGVRESGFADRFFGPICAGKPAMGMGDPSLVHSVSYVPDVGNGLATLGTRPGAAGRAWHLPVAPAWSPEAIAAHAGRTATGRPGKIRRMPRWVFQALGWFDKTVAELPEMDYQYRRPFVLDDGAFRSAFGVGATPLPDAIDATVAAYGAAQRVSSTRALPASS